MFDRENPESRCSQMAAAAICDPDAGTSLDQVPVFEMRWDEWLELHPSTFVLDGDQGFDGLRDLFDTESPYFAQNNPYGGYDEVDGFFCGRSDATHRSPSTPQGTSDRGPPFGRRSGNRLPLRCSDGVGERIRGDRVCVRGPPVRALVERTRPEGGMAFRPETESGQDVSLVSTIAGFRDESTGSTWTGDGRAVSGAMEGERARSPRARLRFILGRVARVPSRCAPVGGVG